MNAPRKRWYIALLEVLVPHSKQLVAAYILWLGIGAGGSFLVGKMNAGSDVLPEPEKPVPVQSAPEVIHKTFCDEDLIVRICSKVMSGHESGPLH